MFPKITINGNNTELLNCFNSTKNKLSNDILTMSGMSGKKFRIFINNLVENTPDAKYLEIGSWYGSTSCSAMFLNKLELTCIDNWSEHNGRDNFLNNTEKFSNENVKLNLIENDFRNVNYNEIGKFNIYMFDGPHNLQDQYDGVFIVQPALTDRYVLIVDDYNHERVREGTQNALKDLNSKIICDIEIRTSDNDMQPSPNCENSDWHNGYYIALIEK